MRPNLIPLDDLTDEEDPSELFDCDDVIVCQFLRVTKNRIPPKVEAPKDKTKDGSKDEPKEGPNDEPKDVSKELSKAVSKDISKEVSKTVSSDVSKEVSKDDLDNKSKDTLENVTKYNWRIQLKDGIMNLNGKDYVFHSLNGDAKW